MEGLKSKWIIQKPKKPNGFEENQMEAKKPDNDNEDDNDKDINKKEKNKRKTFDDVFAEKDFSEELENTIKDFIDMRKTIKKPMTTKALELLIRNLEKLTNLEEEKIAILNQSIEHGWQTVYPLKEKIKIKQEEDYKEIELTEEEYIQKLENGGKRYV